MKIKKLWLPAEHFELDETAQTKIVNGKKYLNITWFELYSFKTNRIKFDSDWWEDFIIEF